MDRTMAEPWRRSELTGGSARSRALLRGSVAAAEATGAPEVP
eukprot:COSAG06_NODE_46139_length_349_cov_0.784000_1_plen_41_part_10